MKLLLGFQGRKIFWQLVGKHSFLWTQFSYHLEYVKTAFQKLICFFIAVGLNLMFPEMPTPFDVLKTKHLKFRVRKRLQS